MSSVAIELIMVTGMKAKLNFHNFGKNFDRP